LYHIIYYSIATEREGSEERFPNENECSFSFGNIPDSHVPFSGDFGFWFLGIKKGLSLVTESRGCRPKLNETSASEMQSAHSFAK